MESMEECRNCYIPLFIVSGVLLCLIIALFIDWVCSRSGNILCCHLRRSEYERFDDEVGGSSSDTKFSPQEQLRLSEKHNQKLEELDRALQKEKHGKEKAMERCTELNERLTKLESELKKERQEKEVALQRLSAVMSGRLRDGNPNVVDLSDQNRPLKIGEQFSELYDNQWTDAFTSLQNSLTTEKYPDSKIIQLLLDSLQECFTICKHETEEELSKLGNNVKDITALVTNEQSRLTDDLMQRIKEERKMHAAERVPNWEEVKPRIKASYMSRDVSEVDIFFAAEPVALYITECLRLCHLMVNQDPPMAIDSRPDSSADKFKAYVTRGSKVMYVVWPALYLQDGGALVSKGVAEFGN